MYCIDIYISYLYLILFIGSQDVVTYCFQVHKILEFTQENRGFFKTSTYEQSWEALSKWD